MAEDLLYTLHGQLCTIMYNLSHVLHEMVLACPD